MAFEEQSCSYHGSSGKKNILSFFFFFNFLFYFFSKLQYVRLAESGPSRFRSLRDEARVGVTVLQDTTPNLPPAPLVSASKPAPGSDAKSGTTGRDAVTADEPLPPKPFEWNDDE